MSRDGGFLLPQSPDAARTRCIRLFIPDDDGHERAFWGALSVLEHWYNWQRDSLQTGARCAQNWRQALYDARFNSDCGGTVSVDCNSLSACFESEAFSSAVTRVTQGGQSATSIYNRVTNTYNSSIPVLNAVCEDAQFAAVRQMVNFICDLISDVWQEIADSPLINSAQLMDVLSRVTVVDEVSADVVAGLIEWVLENLTSAFDAADDQIQRDEFACEVFCRALERNGCDVRLDDFLAVIKSKIDFVWPSLENNIFNALQWLENVILIAVGNGDDEVWYTSLATFFALVQALDSFPFANFLFNGAAAKLYIYLRAFTNDTDPDWQTLCDCEEGWEHVFDFQIGNGGWTLHTPNVVSGTPGVYTNGVGWRHGFFRTSTSRLNGIQIARTSNAVSGRITEVQVQFSKNLGTYNPLNASDFVSATGFYSTVSRTNTSSPWTLTVDEQNGTTLILAMICGVAPSSNPGGTLTISKIIIRGTGTNPFV
jgi:hypothetical protein